MAESSWTRAELARLRDLDTPVAVQAFLDATPYSVDDYYRCPRRVLRDGFAHCVDGAMLAAAALALHGYPPLVFELRAERDDDHLLVPFRVDGHWGAVAKSNCSGLRYREPVYRSRRELVMSYFEVYFNVEAQRCLRSYSSVLDLDRLTAGWSADWRFDDAAIDRVVERLEASRHYPVVTEAMVRRLTPVDARSYAAGLLGADERGLYRPE